MRAGTVPPVRHLVGSAPGAAPSVDPVSNDVPAVGAPAKRALEAAGVRTLDDVRRVGTDAPSDSWPR